MRNYKGLVFVKHMCPGTRSEGPDYYLQTIDRDYQLHKSTLPFEEDPQLEPFVRKIVEVEGCVNHDHEIEIESIRRLATDLIPGR